MRMKKYRKKPVVVEAVQWTKKNEDEVVAFLNTGTRHFCVEHPVIAICTLEGVMYASPGDYIIKGVHGECYPCKPDIFHKTYEEVADEG